jgi:hypothetical protein
MGLREGVATILFKYFAIELTWIFKGVGSHSFWATKCCHVAIMAAKFVAIAKYSTRGFKKNGCDGNVATFQDYFSNKVNLSLDTILAVIP